MQFCSEFAHPADILPIIRDGEVGLLLSAHDLPPVSKVDHRVLFGEDQSEDGGCHRNSYPTQRTEYGQPRVQFVFLVFVLKPERQFGNGSNDVIGICFPKLALPAELVPQLPLQDLIKIAFVQYLHSSPVAVREPPLRDRGGRRQLGAKVLAGEAVLGFSDLLRGAFDDDFAAFIAAQRDRGR